VGTDGTDNGPAAGAVVDGHTWDPVTGSEALSNHDSFSWFQKHDLDTSLNDFKSHIITGPTGTNVMDIAILLVGD
jgi:hydroxypyruvate reductase